MVHLDESAALVLLEGRLPEPAEAAARAHAERCHACRSLLQEIATRRLAAREPQATVLRFWGLEEESPVGPGALESIPGITPGQIVGGRYRLDEPLGEGGMGIVWSAHDPATGERIALKLLKSRGPDEVARFLREARITAGLRHPHILVVHDVFQLPEGFPVMAMERLYGEPLDAAIARGGRIAPGAAAAIVLSIVSAVGAAHAVGVIHRDLKPANVFLARQPDGATRVTVLDFGIAKLLPREAALANTTRLTKSGFVLGTPSYMAPEQVFADSPLDHRVDIWSIGMILYECLTGRCAVAGTSVMDIFRNITVGDIPPIERVRPGLPPALAHLVGRMLTRDRDRRPGDLREVYEVLAPIAERG